MTEAAARVAAELEIRNTISRIAILADQGDLDEYVDQFTEGAVWDLPGDSRHGRADIRAGAEQRRAEGVTGPGTATRHVITTVSVAVDGPDAALANAYFTFFQNTAEAPSVLNMGVYHDRFERVGARWRLAYRQITFG